MSHRLAQEEENWQEGHQSGWEGGVCSPLHSTQRKGRWQTLFHPWCPCKEGWVVVNYQWSQLPHPDCTLYRRSRREEAITHALAIREQYIMLLYTLFTIISKLPYLQKCARVLSTLQSRLQPLLSCRAKALASENPSLMASIEGPNRHSYRYVPGIKALSLHQLQFWPQNTTHMPMLKP